MTRTMIGDHIAIPNCSASSSAALITVSWTENFTPRSSRYYVVRAINKQRDDAEVLMFIEKRIYEGNGISKINCASNDGEYWHIAINEDFQYGQQNAQGGKRFLVLHDKIHRVFQHRFMITTLQSKVAAWARVLVIAFGGEELQYAVEIADKLGKQFIGDYLHTFRK